MKRQRFSRLSTSHHFSIVIPSMRKHSSEQRSMRRRFSLMVFSTGRHISAAPSKTTLFFVVQPSVVRQTSTEPASTAEVDFGSAIFRDSGHFCATRKQTACIYRKMLPEFSVHRD